MKLSIIVPVYNMAAGNKLRFCLDSLVNQTIADYEIIAVDDASTDESLDILKEYEISMEIPCNTVLREQKTGWCQKYGAGGCQRHLGRLRGF